MTNVDNHTLAQRGYELVTNSDIAERVEKRKAEAMRQVKSVEFGVTSKLDGD